MLPYLPPRTRSLGRTEERARCREHHVTTHTCARGGPYWANKVLFLHTAFPVLSLTAAHLGVSALFTRVALALGVFQARNAKFDWTILTVTVGRCRLSVSNPELKARLVSALETTRKM
jgi:hypothetical protein